MSKQPLLKVTDFYKPTLEALIKLGGSGSTRQAEPIEHADAIEALPGTPFS